MKENPIKSLSISKLQLSLAKTLKDATANHQLITVTHWREPSHIIIPVNILTPEFKALLPPELLTQKCLPLAEEIFS